MCETCQELAHKYLGPWMPEDEMYDFMFSNTCFPMGGPEHIEPQLRQLDFLAHSVGIKWAAAVLHGVWDFEYERTRRGETPWWNFLPLVWCDGLEQPQCET